MSLIQVGKQLFKHLESKDVQLDFGKIVKAIEYLEYYGYIKKDQELKLSDVITAVGVFQEFFHLEQDGVLGPKTFRAMEQPRCSVPDLMNRTEEARWRKTKLTYYIRNRDTDLGQREWDAAIAKAWAYWMEVADIEVTQINNANADIIIDIGSGRKDNFDGPSGTLAWAYLPNGRDNQLLCKFDSAETWVLDSRTRGILLINVACHEFGHLLGLEHSKVQSALMAPYYSPSIEKPQQKDDVTRIVGLYGAAKKPAPKPEPEPEPPTGNDGTKMTIILEGKITIPGYRVSPL